MNNKKIKKQHMLH